MEDTSMDGDAAAPEWLRDDHMQTKAEEEALDDNNPVQKRIGEAKPVAMARAAAVIRARLQNDQLPRPPPLLKAVRHYFNNFTVAKYQREMDPEAVLQQLEDAGLTTQEALRVIDVNPLSKEELIPLMPKLEAALVPPVDPIARYSFRYQRSWTPDELALVDRVLGIVKEQCNRKPPWHSTAGMCATEARAKELKLEKRAGTKRGGQSRQRH